MGLLDKVRSTFNQTPVPGARNTCVDAANKAIEVLKETGIDASIYTVGAEKGRTIHKYVTIPDGKNQIIVDSSSPKKEVFGKNGKPTGETREDNTKKKWFVQ